MSRQQWCVGSGRQVSTPHNIGGRLASCASCARADLQINKDGTLRFHVAYLVADEPRMRTTSARQPPSAPPIPPRLIFR